MKSLCIEGVADCPKSLRELTAGTEKLKPNHYEIWAKWYFGTVVLVKEFINELQHIQRNLG